MGNVIEPDTYAVAFELYNSGRRIIIGNLRLSGKNLYIIETVVDAALYRRRIQETMEFEEFCNVLKIPARLV